MTQLLTSPRTKRAANVLGIVVLIALVAPFAVFAAPEVVGADESFVVLTASMTPSIAPGDVVIVAERDPAAVAAGDVITFMRGTSEVPVTHRVIDVVDEGGALAFETMGDANEGPDPGLVPGSNLVGVVVFTIPYIGYVIQFAGTRAGFVALVVLPFGLLAASELLSVVRSRNGGAPDAAAVADADSAAETDAFVDANSPADATSTAECEPALPPETATEPPAQAESEAGATTAASATDAGGVSVDAVGGAVAMLAVFAPYAIYVAIELQTAATIAVAVAATTVLLGGLATWVPASGVLDRATAEPPTTPASPDGETVAADDPPDGSLPTAPDGSAVGPAQTDGAGEAE
ncbi:signal peptidase I [Halorubrum sp. SD626R]|uniref:signal peptidase I n=1 Tax=Halorubrum sp. SD626R TaxID=1419722 RepID=UPI000AE47106|nr:signal peptidase I [Halorubrum sp. SD626R]TKX79755.1 signal peptidase I [Halorubrum sp. SD626R]